MSLGPSSGILSPSLPTTLLTSPFVLPTPVVLAETVTASGTPTSNKPSSLVTSCAEHPPTPGPPNVVHVVIHTTVTISDYSHFYKDTPITSFRPSYTALGDGSLVSPVFQPNLAVSEGWQVLAGAMAVFFLRNTFRAIQYTRIVNAKNKSLFHMLSLSQIIGIVVVAVFTVANFVPELNCTRVGMFKKAGELLSSTLLVTGILGTKVYRCLSNAGFVLVILAFMRAAIIAVWGVVIAEYRGGRRFTGTCETEHESSLLPVATVLAASEACFICLCFMWAVYRSYRSPTEFARLSLALSEEEDSSREKSGLTRDASRRGWWDYVPNPNNEKRLQPIQVVCPPSRCDPENAACPARRFKRWLSGEPVLPSTVFQPRESIANEPTEAYRISSLSLPNSAPIRLSTAREPDYRRPSSPPPPSVMDRIIRYVPRAELFRSMLKNELLYTTFISAALLVIAVVMLVGVTQELLLGPNSWIMLDWLVISLCTMHSFSRVARRHEREAWLQDPANWGSMRRAEVEDATTLRPRNPRRAWSPVSVDWRQRQRRREDSSVPSGSTDLRDTLDLSDAATTSARESRVRSLSVVRSPRSPERPSPRVRSPSPSPVPSAPVDGIPRLPCLRTAGPGSPTILPSPDWPSTHVSTPYSASRSSLGPPLLRSSSAPASRSRRRSRSVETHSPCPCEDSDHR